MAAAFPSAPTPSAVPQFPSLDQQAHDLWVYVQLGRRYFSVADARAALSQATPEPGDDPKQLAGRLRAALKPLGVALKHNQALEAAARMLGHKSFQESRRVQAKVRLTASLLTGARDPERRQLSVTTWRDLADALVTSCRDICGREPTCVFRLEVDPKQLVIWYAYRTTDGRVSHLPLASVRPVTDDDAEWLDDAAPVIETLRRNLEEPGLAVLDGAAVFEFAGLRAPGTTGDMPPLAYDLSNAELVLQREDGDMQTGFEVARGDEVSCWAELDLLREGAAVTFSESDGTWLAGGGRYLWDFEVLRPHDYVPGRHVHSGSVDLSKALFRRYRLAERARAKLGAPSAPRGAAKSLHMHRDLTKTVRINKHEVLLAFEKAGIPWQSYWQDEPTLTALPDVMDTGRFWTLLQDVKPEHPGQLLAMPMPSELEAVDDDRALQAVLGRVNNVRFRLPGDLTDSERKAAIAAVAEFRESIRIWQFAQAVVAKELAWVSHTDDASVLFRKTVSLGLRIRMGVLWDFFAAGEMPFAAGTELANMPPYAVGRSLFLHLERDGVVA